MKITTHQSHSEIVRTNILMGIITEHLLSMPDDFSFITFTFLLQNPKSITKILSVTNNSTNLYNECVIENGSLVVRDTPTLLHSSDIHRQAIIRCILIIDRMDRIYGTEALNKVLDNNDKCQKFMNLFKKVNSKISENIEIERLLFSSFEILRIYQIGKMKKEDFDLSELCSLRVCYNIAKSVQEDGYRTMYFASLPSHSFNQFDLTDYSMNIELYDNDPDISYHKTVVLLLMNAISEAKAIIGEDLEFEENIEKGNIGKALSMIKDFITP